LFTNYNIPRSNLYNRICIIGVGALGGFVTDAISNLEEVEEIIIIDFDKVEEKNLKNSIYRQKDINNFKVDALFDIVSSRNEKVKIKPINIKFIENQNEIPKCDLVLDCRDYTCNRQEIIDARMYISSRYLIIDCRKNVSYKKHFSGRYLTELSKEDLRNASFTISMLIYNHTIFSLIENQKVTNFELDYLKKTKYHINDIIYDYNQIEERLTNLDEYLPRILERNKKADLKVHVGSKTMPIISKTIPMNMLNNGNDVIINLVSMLNLPIRFNNYIVNMSEKKSDNNIELIPETGAA